LTASKKIKVLWLKIICLNILYCITEILPDLVQMFESLMKQLSEAFLVTDSKDNVDKINIYSIKCLLSLHMNLPVTVIHFHHFGHIRLYTE
jgi:hypothetical protein